MRHEIYGLRARAACKPSRMLGPPFTPPELVLLSPRRSYILIYP